MPVDGLSLVGFMDEPEALQYFRSQCAVQQYSDDQLSQQWRSARQRLGQPMDEAGVPDIQDIPPEYQKYLDDVKQSPRYEDTVRDFHDHKFKLIQIDRLLAFQFHVGSQRSIDLCQGVSQNPPMDVLLKKCLPLDIEAVPSVGTYFPDAQRPVSILIRSHSLNFRVQHRGMLGGVPDKALNIAGVTIGISSPLVQVVRYDGRCYLRNGFHRVCGLRRARATHVPCVFLDATNVAQIGIPGVGASFQYSRLVEPNPPTCGHLIPSRAHAVKLRQASRYINVSWSEYDLMDDA